MGPYGKLRPLPWLLAALCLSMQVMAMGIASDFLEQDTMRLAPGETRLQGLRPGSMVAPPPPPRSRTKYLLREFFPPAFQAGVFGVVVVSAAGPPGTHAA